MYISIRLLEGMNLNKRERLIDVSTGRGQIGNHRSRLDSDSLCILGSGLWLAVVGITMILIGVSLIVTSFDE